jgi:hypothetical protein
MNNRYFICKKRRKYTDAGYRWAFWQLEEKQVVALGRPVDVGAVLRAQEYWNPSESERNDWLCAQILPTVKEFLETHNEEGIEYADEEFLAEQWELGYEWREMHPIKRDEQGVAPNA